MRVAIIGTGLQCQRRAAVVMASPDDKLAVVCGPSVDAADASARKFGCESAHDWKAVNRREDVDAVLVCTPPNMHTPISVDAMRNGKHVLCEKPLCRSMKEAQDILDVVKETGRVFKCGFNHRYHPAILEAKRLLDGGDLGKPLFGRCRYGLVGRPGYENEWRADPNQAVGGHLGEQGVHGIDLFRWFMGDVADVSCMTSIQYFKKQSMEDNGMAVFRMTGGGTASLHSSMTQWKNLFSLEIFGEDGYAIADGLGGSYGVETLTWGRRDFTAPFSNTTVEYRGGDSSWASEWKDFSQAVHEGRQPAMGNVEDGIHALRITLACYESSRNRRFVSPDEIGSKPS
jgi:predicted dehydrogenase